jgi:5-formyltetrahydrofolate cyclo-ligase
VSDFAREAERLRSAKVALRSQMLTARRSLSEAIRRAADRSVQASTVAWLRAARPTVCAAYVPVGTEPGGPDLPDILAGDRTVLLPVLLPDGDLDWAPHDGTLRRSARGLLEPAGHTLGTSAISQADVIIVPAVAVSRTGTRLGRGGGCYDRALTRARSAFVIALLHDGELLDEVPAEPHDRPVNAVVTPREGLVVLDPR